MSSVDKEIGYKFWESEVIKNERQIFFLLFFQKRFAHFRVNNIILRNLTVRILLGSAIMNKSISEFLSKALKLIELHKKICSTNGMDWKVDLSLFISLRYSSIYLDFWSRENQSLLLFSDVSFNILFAFVGSVSEYWKNNSVFFGTG